MKNLGKLLAANIAAENEAKAAEVRKQAAAAEKARQRIREKRSSLISKMVNKIVNDIENGNTKPRYRVEDYGVQDWIMLAFTYVRNNQGRIEEIRYEASNNIDVWAEFILEMRECGLKINAVYGHDGIGIKSWVDVVALPLENE